MQHPPSNAVHLPNKPTQTPEEVINLIRKAKQILEQNAQFLTCGQKNHIRNLLQDAFRHVTPED